MEKNDFKIFLSVLIENLNSSREQIREFSVASVSNYFLGRTDAFESVITSLKVLGYEID